MKWKFPKLELEAFEDHSAYVFSYADKAKYRRLSDLDAAVESASPMILKANKEVGEEYPNFVKAASFQVLLALALVDDNIRRFVSYQPFAAIVDKYALK